MWMKTVHLASRSRQGMSNQLGMGNEMQDQGIGTDRLTNDSQNITGDRINDATVSRVEEELQVGKREVEKGGVRLRSRFFLLQLRSNMQTFSFT